MNVINGMTALVCLHSDSDRIGGGCITSSHGVDQVVKCVIQKKSLTLGPVGAFLLVRVSIPCR